MPVFGLEAEWGFAVAFPAEFAGRPGRILPQWQPLVQAVAKIRKKA